MIASLVIPCVVAAIEYRDKPVLRRGPLIVAQADKVYAVSAEAALVGIQPGMALRRARALCPTALVVDASPLRYRQVFEQVLGILMQFTHLVEPVDSAWQLERSPRRTKKTSAPIAERDSLSAAFYLNLEALHDNASAALARQMIQAVTDQTALTPSVGLASGKFPARLAAASADPGTVRQVVPGGEASFLADLPIDALPMDAELARRLRLLGIETLGQIAALPASSFGLQFGKTGLTLRELACGRDSRPVIAYRPVPMAQRARQFDEPVSNRLTLQNIVRDTAADLAADLHVQGLMTRRVELSLTLEGGQVRERWKALRQPTAQAGQIAAALEECLDYLKASAGVTAIAVTLPVLVAAVGQQLDLFAPQAAQSGRLRDAVQQVTPIGSARGLPGKLAATLSDARYGGYCFRLAPAPRKSRLPGRDFVFEPAGEL